MITALKKWKNYSVNGNKRIYIYRSLFIREFPGIDFFCFNGIPLAGRPKPRVALHSPGLFTMKIFLKLLFSVLLSGLLLGASPEKALLSDTRKEMLSVSVVFDNVAGSQNLVLDKKEYSNAAGESFNISQLQYFVSNIKFHSTDGTTYTVNQDNSYFLVQENNPATQVIKLKIPAGDYDRMIFVLGVDSLRNTLDISKRTGVLDPSSAMDNGMYWGWNSGYIFLKMEGNSPAAPEDPTGNHKFRFHIGGFGGYSAPTINNIKTISLDLTKRGILKMRKERKEKLIVKADVLTLFNGITNLSIAAHPSVMFSEYSVHVANNYSKMFFHDRTEN